MEESQPGYYSVTPAEVRYSEELTANAKLLYGEISALTNKSGTCWASNQYFANLYKVNKTTVSDWIGQLIKAGFIEVDISRGVYRKIRIPLRNFPNTPSEKAEHNNKTNSKLNILPKGNRENSATLKAGLKDTPSPLEAALADFAEHRKKLRRPMTMKALELMLKKLELWYPGNTEKQIACLEQSIENGWQGVFELKNDKPSGNVKGV